jgi:hypothetical protein
MELSKLFHNRVRLPHGRVFHRFVSSHTGKGESAELLGDSYSGGSLVDAAGFIVSFR